MLLILLVFSKFISDFAGVLALEFSVLLSVNIYRYPFGMNRPIFRVFSRHGKTIEAPKPR